MAGFMKLVVWQEAAVTMAKDESPVPASEAERGVPIAHTHELVRTYRPEMGGHIAGSKWFQCRTCDAWLEDGGLKWWGKYSAPGYMDQTETTGPWDTAQEAALETFGLFGEKQDYPEDMSTADEDECIDMLVSMGMTREEAINKVMT